MKKYTYSRTIGNETFSAVEFDSFEEAVTAVNKGVRDAIPQGIPTPTVPLNLNSTGFITTGGTVNCIPSDIDQGIPMPSGELPRITKDEE